MKRQITLISLLVLFATTACQKEYSIDIADKAGENTVATGIIADLEPLRTYDEWGRIVRVQHPIDKCETALTYQYNNVETQPYGKEPDNTNPHFIPDPTKL